MDRLQEAKNNIRWLRDDGLTRWLVDEVARLRAISEIPEVIEFTRLNAEIVRLRRHPTYWS